MLRIRNLRLPVTDNTELAELAAKKLRLPPREIRSLNILHRALDARRKNNICFVYSLDVEVGVPEGQVLSRLKKDANISIAAVAVREEPVPGTAPLSFQPVIMGAGPAGLLAAYILAKYGYRPLLLERGRDVDARTEDVAQFWRTGTFNPISNVQFGEGGAGTFSDGKLTTRVSDPHMEEILNLFVEAGAPAEIRYLHKPHVGTDKLRTMVRNLRQQIMALGGEIQFEARVSDIEVENGKIAAVIVNDNRRIPAEVVLAGIGHSARDTYAMLYRRGIAMERKAFAIGVRVEHPQALIDEAQYGGLAGHPSLGAADYALVFHDKASGRTAYSFCMCPGGLVVAAASEADHLVTNGMSLYNRDSGIANSALVVNVAPEDYGPGVLDGIEFQRQYEHAAFIAGKSSYYAPVQTIGNFLHQGTNTQFLTEPSYRPGVVSADLHSCLPAFVTRTLEMALPDFGRRVRGFDHPQALLTGVETRTSAPVRILRKPDYMSVNVGGFYPIGEGAGYAGGIMSAALDGMNAAISVIQTYKAP